MLYLFLEIMLLLLECIGVVLGCVLLLGLLYLGLEYCVVWVEVEVDGIIIFMVSWVGVDLISYFDM